LRGRLPTFQGGSTDVPGWKLALCPCEILGISV
jgi:hypothetical protein